MEPRRQPFKERFIKDLNVEDFKVALNGTIINKTDKSFFLDDGSGEILVTSDNIPDYDYVRVFGRLVPYEEGFELQAEIIQDLSKVDKELFRKVKELMNKD